MHDAEAISFPNPHADLFPTPIRASSRGSLLPEQRLMVAVLEHAVEEFRTYAFISTGRGRFLFMEVAAWFRSAATGAFDFEGICQIMGLEPDCIRKALHDWYAAAARSHGSRGPRDRCGVVGAACESA